MNIWNFIYWKQEISFCLWLILLGMYISMVLFDLFSFNEIWWMFVFIIFWIIINRLIWKYSKFKLKGLVSNGEMERKNH